MKKALITGITGQDGSYLAELLLSKGYEVHGIIRRASTFNTHRIDHIYSDPHNSSSHLFLHYGDLLDPGVFIEIIFKIKPDELYHLGAQSHVRVSFDMPEFTGSVTGLGTTRILEAIKRSDNEIKLYNASSSEMFGPSVQPHNENTPFHPCSPYAAAKVYAHWMAVNYREAYDLFISNGILFNHESPRRGETFVSRKITRALAHILNGNQNKLFLGNLEARRDWGFAPEYVEAMWLMMQQEKPGDFVIGTGETHTVREFVESAFSYAGIGVEWKGEGKKEKGIVSFVSDQTSSVKKGDVVIEIDERYFRPTEVDTLCADTRKAREQLGWSSRTTFLDLVKIMVDYDMLQIGLEPIGEGILLSCQKGFSYTRHEFSFSQKNSE
jgi:GDPmannose 4,6-dehydratase